GAALQRLGGAIGSLGQGLGALGEGLRQRRERQDAFDANIAGLKFQGDLNRQHLGRAAAVMPGAGAAQAAREEADQARQAFLASLPDTQRAKWEERLTTQAENHQTRIQARQDEVTQRAALGSFEAEWEAAKSNRVAGMPEGGAGYVEATMAEFDKQFAETLKGLSPRQQEQFKARMTGARERAEIAAQLAADNERLRYEVEQSSEQLIGLSQQVEGNPALAGQVLDQGLELIGSMGLSPEEKSKTERLWRNSVGTARLAATARTDPEAANRLLGYKTTPGDAVSQVISTGRGFNVVRRADGVVERRTGTRASRNNNPGNIEYGKFAKANGAIATDGRFAIFPTVEAGFAAQSALLFETDSYRNLSLAQAINRYAPPSENDTGAYVRVVARAAGVTSETPLASLTGQQRATVVRAMAKHEGFKATSAVLEADYENAASVPVSYESVPVHYSLQGKIRNIPPTEALLRPAQIAVSRAAPGYGFMVVSGGQPANGVEGVDRTGGHRHNIDENGVPGAMDIVLTQNGQVVRPDEAPELYERVLEEMAAAGFEGIGHYSWGIHVGGGSRAAWGPDTTGKTLDARYGAAIRRGWARQGGQPGAPIAEFDPDSMDQMFRHMDFKQREGALALIQQQASAAREQQEAFGQLQADAAAAEYSTALEDLKLAIHDRTARRDDVAAFRATFEDNPSFTVKDLENLEQRTADAEAQSFAEENAAAIVAGGATLNPFDSDQRKQADAAYTLRVGDSNPIGDPAAQAQTVAIAQTGVVPAGAIAALRQGITSQSAQTVASALQLASILRSVAPQGFQGRSGADEITDAIAIYEKRLAVGETQEQAARSVAALNDPEVRQNRKVALTSDDAKAFFEREATPDRIAREMGVSVEGIGGSLERQAAVVGQYRTLLEDAYIRAQGDGDNAKAIANERFKKLYGVSGLALDPGGVFGSPEQYLSRRPPELTYPAIDGDHDYLRNAVAEGLTEAGIEFEDFRLVADAETEVVAQAGALPPYRVIYKDTDGAWQSVTGDRMEGAQFFMTAAEINALTAEVTAQRAAEAAEMQAFARQGFVTDEALNVQNPILPGLAGALTQPDQVIDPRGAPPPIARTSMQGVGQVADSAAATTGSQRSQMMDNLADQGIGEQPNPQEIVRTSRGRRRRRPAR
ncbi:MAG: hypothetical protein AAF692_07695, partial [Pseudomonadota bacterium]